MKITILILTTAILQVSASTYGQNVTLKERNASLSAIFTAIKKQTGYDFLYSDKTISDAKPITVDIKNGTIEQALKAIFNGQQLAYEIKANTVVITSSEPSLLDKALLIIQRIAKEIDVRGKVLDENGLPLAGATIKVKGSNRTTKTNAQGEFSLQGVDENAIVEISFIGYAVQEVRATTNIGTISMTLADAKLEEVMINAGYYTVKDKERTGSIARITAKDIEKQPVNSPLAAMQGRISGVNITQNTGLPGGGFNIQIRGLNSIRGEGNDPLYIVNGVPYSSQSLGDPTVSSTGISGLVNPLNNLNTADIESIEILKDADATAIYGSRGANGVVLITTKRGTSGKARLNLNAFTTIGQVARKMGLMNTSQYLAMRTEAFSNDGIAKYPDAAYDINGTWDKNRNTDWQKELLGGKANIHNVQASVSGGNSNTQFLLSGTYRKETTVFPGDFDYKKGAFSSNISHQSEDRRFVLNFSASYSGDKNTLPGRDLTFHAYTLAPNAPPLYDTAGNLNWENGTFINP